MKKLVYYAFAMMTTLFTLTSCDTDEHTVVVAASSYDAGVFPVMHDFLYHLQIKNYQKRRFGIIENGSWAPTAGKVMRSMIEGLKDCEIVEPMVTILSRMKAADEALLEQLADSLLS